MLSDAGKFYDRCTGSHWAVSEVTQSVKLAQKFDFKMEITKNTFIGELAEKYFREVQYLPKPM